MENDKIKDKKAEDVEFTFVDTPFLEFKTHDGKTSIKTAAFWSDKEAAIVDQAFAELQTKTSNTRLLKTADGDEMIVKRFGTWVYADGRGAGLAYNGGGTIGFGSAVFTDKTTGAEAPEKAHEVVFHEIGHNWDTREERDWVEETDDYNWKNRSGWTQDDMSGDSRYTKSGNDEWYYENSADFVRDYAKHNPREDFASHFAAYFMREAEETSGRGIDPIESAPLKEEFIDRFIDSL